MERSIGQDLIFFVGCLALEKEGVFKVLIFSLYILDNDYGCLGISGTT